VQWRPVQLQGSFRSLPLLFASPLGRKHPTGSQGWEEDRAEGDRETGRRFPWKEGNQGGGLVTVRLREDSAQEARWKGE